MKNSWRNNFLLVLAILGLNLHQANAFNDLLVYGDSLSDIGNGLGAPYTNDKGKVWPVILAEDYYGFSVFASNNGGTAWAVGGTETKDVLRQVDNSISRQLLFTKEQAFSVWSGGNDFVHKLLKIIPDKPEKIAEVAVKNIKTSLDKLHFNGAYEIIVLNLPDLSKTPGAKKLAGIFGKSFIKKFQKGSQIFNKKLAEMVLNLPYSVTIIDIQQKFNDITTNPGNYNLKDVENAFKDCSSNCVIDDYLFYDELHPTTKGHHLIAEFVRQNLAS